MKKPSVESSRLVSRHRLMRVIGRPEAHGRLKPVQKMSLFFALLLLLTALIAWLDPRPTLRHVKLTLLSGAASGNYHATVDRLAAEVARRRGRIRNEASAGSAENVSRLIAAKQSCEVQFALVQAGTLIPDGAGLEVLGRLPQPESLILLGRDLHRIATPRDLAGLRVGIGPVGSGTEQLMRRLLAELPGLRPVVSMPAMDLQLALLERGELDLGAMVIDPNAALLHDAVMRRGLQILDLPEAAALARRLPFLRPASIEAGQIDYVGQVPPRRVDVLEMDTLVVGNGCAGNGATVGLLTALTAVFPSYVLHNKGSPNLSGMPMSEVAANFLRDEGPDVLGTYAPWAVDILPLPTWVQIGVGLSLLFSLMGVGHRFNLWRIDAQRVKIEREIPRLFRPGITLGDIAEMPPDTAHASGAARAELDALIGQLDALAERCRRKSLSILVPMGEEMSYRYQESLIAELTFSLRLYCERLPGNAT